MLVAVVASAGGCATDPLVDGPLVDGSLGDPQHAQQHPAEPSVAVPRVAEPFRAHHDARAGCRFPVPVSDFKVTSRHFDPSGPIDQIRHQITVTLGDHQAVRIDLWDDPQRRPAAAWLERHLSFLLDDSRSATTRRLTAWDLEGLVLEHPSSPQAHPRTTALVAAGGRVFLITCLLAHDSRAVALFERIITEFEPEVTP